MSVQDIHFKVEIKALKGYLILNLQNYLMTNNDFNRIRKRGKQKQISSVSSFKNYTSHKTYQLSEPCVQIKK